MPRLRKLFRVHSAPSLIRGSWEGFFLFLLLIFPLILAADPTTPREANPQEKPKPILDAPSLRIPSAPAYPITFQELGYRNVDDLLKQNLQTQNSILSVAFDGEGQIASGSSDGSVKLWDVKTGNLKQTMQTQSPVWSVAFDGKGQIASGSDDGTVKLWDAKTSDLKQTLQAGKLVFSIAFDGGGQLASGSGDGTIKLWDVQSGNLKQTLQIQSGVLSLAFDEEGQIASGAEDGTIKLWDVETGNLKQTLQGHTNSVRSVAFDRGGQIASGSGDGTVKLWDVKTGHLKQTLQAQSRVLSVAFDGGGQIASGSDDGTIKLWDVQSGNLKQTLQTQNSVFSVAFDGGGQLASGLGDGTIKLWDVQSGNLKQTLQIQSGVLSLAFDEDEQLASGAYDGTVKLWDVKTGHLKQTLQAQSSVLSVAFDGGGQLASGASDGTVKLWDVKTGHLKQTLQAQSRVWSVAFDGGGQLASGSDDGTVKLWDIKTGHLKQTLQAQSSVLSVAFDGGGQLASGASDGTVKLWDVKTGNLKQTLQAHTDSVRSVAFDGGGQLASGASDGTVKLWDVKTGHLKQTLQAQSRVFSVAFDGSGQLASGSYEGTVKLWDVKTGNPKQTLQAGNLVLSVAFAKGGQLASCSGDGVIKLWNAEKGVLAKVLLAGARGVWASIASDGEVSRADDGNLLRTGTLLDEGKYPYEEQERNKNGKPTEKILHKEGEYSSYRWQYLPAPDSSAATWSLQLDTATIDLQAGKDGKAAIFTLALTNTSSQPVHRPHILPTTDAEGILQVIPNEPQPAYPQAEAIYSSTSLIPPGQTIKLAARIFPTTNQPAASKQYTLPIKVEVSGGTSKQVDLLVNLKTPDVVLASNEFSSDTNTLSIQLKNQGTADLPQTDFYLTDPEIKLDLPRQTLEGIPAQSDAPPLAFTLPKDMSREQRDRLQLDIRPMRPPLYTSWHIPLEISPMPAHLQILLAILTLGLFGFSVFYFRRYRHPLVLELGANPPALLCLPLEQLPEAQQRLQQTRRLSTVLDNAEVSRDTLKQAIGFQQASAEQKAQMLAMRLGGTLEQKISQPQVPFDSAQGTDSGTTRGLSETDSGTARGLSETDSGTARGLSAAEARPELFSLKLPATFPLNADRILLYFPTTDAQDAFTHLQAIPQAEGRITLIIGPDSAYQRKLLNTTQDLSNKTVAPQSRQLTDLLLSPHAETALAKIMSEQLSLKQISPYQIGGGVNKETIFFGRRELIAQIVNRDPANYLLVGGRQMGKSTLLKALERRYADNPQVQCHYHTLSNEVMVPRLASALQLPRTDDAETFAAALEQRIRDTGQRYVFLIDEADRFIEHEQVRGYPILNVFRRLSEQGHCSFILAGFWQLYQHAVLDYQSPLRNFGEVLEIGALERDACQQLATEPMQKMNVGYASDAIVQDMIEKCGQRANLIAYVCHQLIQNLPAQQRTIEAGDIHRVLDSRDMSKRLEGWVVGINEQEQRYDRLVVYSTIGKESFSTGELIQQLEAQNLAFDAAELERTLSRLELAFVLGRASNRWHYCVPLFVDYIRADDPEVKLAAVLRQW